MPVSHYLQLDFAMSNSHVIAGGHASAFTLNIGDEVRITNIEGSQVVDAWAFNRSNFKEFLSNEHTRSCLQKLIPGKGDQLYSSYRKAMLTITEDTSPGIHDMLLSACDLERYRLLGHVGYHRNCADNLREALDAKGYSLEDIPSPFNIFENVLIDSDGSLSIQPPVVQAGQWVTLRAEQDIVLVLSSCPMDMTVTNGPDMRSKPVKIDKFSTA